LSFTAFAGYMHSDVTSEEFFI